MRKSIIKTCICCISLAIAAMMGCDKSKLEDRVHEFTLGNGMKWFLLKRGYAPIFAGIVQVKAGGVDEVPGKTGIAHMLEHMSFKGTSTIGTNDFGAEKAIMDKIDKLIEEKADPGLIYKLLEEERKFMAPNELWDIFSRNGANNLNAYTSKDVTTFHAEMPNSKLELWIYLTYEMISDPVFREFYPEKNVVLEELRTSIDNSPRGRLYKAVLESAYEQSPYKWPTIGLSEDVELLTRSDLYNFYKNNYLPECMVGAVVGDIDIKETEGLLKNYFGKLKGRDNICHREFPIDPPQAKERDMEISYDAEPILAIAFHKPTVPNFDDYIFDVFSYLLCEGESSRMQKVLVKDKRIAKRIDCSNSYPGSRLSNLFVIYAEPFDVSAIDELKNEIIGELGKLIDEPVTGEEFEKVKNKMKTDFLMNIDTNFNLAHMLVYYQNVTDDWHYIVNHPENVDRITEGDLMQAAKTYFTNNNMTVIKLKRKENEKTAN